MGQLTPEVREKIRESYNRTLSYKKTSVETGVDWRKVKKVVIAPPNEESKTPKSVQNRAYSLYARGNSPVDVANDLSISADEALGYHLEYLKLIGKGELAKSLARLDTQETRAILSLQSELEKLRLSPSKFAFMLNLTEKLKNVEARTRNQDEILSSRRSEVRAINDQFQKTSVTLASAQRELSKVTSEKVCLNGEITNLESQRNQILAEIRAAKSDTSLAKFKELAEQEARRVLDGVNRRRMIAIAVSCMIDALRYDRKTRIMLELGASSENEATRLYGDSLTNIVERSFDAEAKRFTSQVISQMANSSNVLQAAQPITSFQRIPFAVSIFEEARSSKTTINELALH